MIVRPMSNENRAFLYEAYQYAVNSPDPSTQNGAVIIGRDGRLRCGFGYNGFPVGYDSYRVESTPERLERPLKYSYVEHAERAAIFRAAYVGESTRCGTMYVPWYACTECARAIVMSGISLVVGHKQMYDKTTERWKESIAIAMGILDEGGVRHYLADGNIGDPHLELRFDGQLWTP